MSVCLVGPVRPGTLGTEGTPLFSGSEPPSVPVDTSEAAATRVHRSGQRQRDYAAVLAYLGGQPAGATTAQIQAATGIHVNAIRPVLLELSHGIGSKYGKVARCGMGRIRQTPRKLDGSRIWEIQR